MLKPPIPDDDDQRVAALQELNLLDSPAEESYDRVVRELAELLSFPIAYVALIDENRQWLKSTTGNLACEMGRESAFCSYTILGTQPLIIPDTKLDPRFVDHPLVVAEPFLRFYAGVPLAANGQNIGTLCIADSKPRTLEASELETLLEYAQVIEDKINAVPKVFISYSHQDEEWKDRLVRHLSVLEQQSLIDVWEDRSIGGGSEWEPAILDAMESSSIAVLLVSANYLTSDFIMGVEVPSLLERRGNEGLTIVPVVIKPCRWQNVPWLAKLNMRPTDAKPLSGTVDHQIDEILAELGGEILSLSIAGPGRSPALQTAAAPLPAEIAPAPSATTPLHAPDPPAAPAEAVPDPPAPVASAPVPTASEPAVPEPVSRGTGDDPSVNSVLVLPIADLSRERDQEYLCDGIAEDLITSLVGVDGLRVASRSSFSQLKGTSEDVISIARRFGVDAVLEGSLRTSGDRLRINMQLTKASDGLQLWAERFNREATDVFEIQEEIAEQVAHALDAQIVNPPKEPSGKPSEDDLETYHLCLKGRHLWNKRTTVALKGSLNFFQAAVEITPDYLPAHLGLANVWAVLGLYGIEPPSESMPQAKASALNAIALDADQSEAYAALGCVQSTYEWSWTEGEASFKQAVDLDRDNPIAHQWYAINHLVPLGRFEEALESLDRARRLDPLSTPILASRGLLHYFAGEFERAETSLRATLEIEPDFALCHQILGQVLTEQSRHEEAIAAGERAIEITGGAPETTAMLAYSVGKAGDRPRMVELIEELSQVASEKFVPATLFAMTSIAAGDSAGALERLREAAEARSPSLVFLRVRPTYRELHSESAFKALAETVGLVSTDD